MKIRLALYLLCSCLVFSQAFAQQAEAYRTGVDETVYFLDSTDQTLKPLPRETGKAMTNQPHPNLRAQKMSTQISGPASSFRLKSGKDLEFVVKCTNPENYELHAFKIKGKNREALISTSKVRFSGNETMQRENVIAFDETKYGESSYRFVVKGLAPGEYAFLDDWNVFDFAVDAQ